MNKLTLGLIGYGNVGSGVVKFLQTRREFIKYKFNLEFHIKAIADRSIHTKKFSGLDKTRLTTNPQELLTDPEIDVIVRAYRP